MVKYYIDKHLVDMVESSKWLVVGATDFMNIKKSLPLHYAIERIYLNVALSYSVSWQEIMTTSGRNTRLLSAKIVILLLINSILKSYYEMKDYEINLFIGGNDSELLEEYFDYIKGKKS
jgi:hypothetical protein